LIQAQAPHINPFLMNSHVSGAGFKR